MLLFDTGKKLEKAFTQEQFAALVEVLESREEKASSKVDLRETELRLQKEIEVVRVDLKATELRLQKEIVQSKSESIKWTAGLLTAQTAAIIAAIIAIMK